MKLDAEQQTQILTPAVRRIMDVAREAGGEARVVGGAVRDVIRGGKIGDIDLASTLPPQRMMEILPAQGIKIVPTGLAHGTVTAVVDHVGYEITTLRHDVETDGRRAQVEFTDDWQSDAARRDFTMNALYADADGTLYDYFGGAEDARTGHVRFIGDAEARIREDVLRILRFFRFYAWFGKGDPDDAALSACRALANLTPTLSAERVAKEILKLLAAENPVAAWRLMMDSGVAAQGAGEAVDIARLSALIEREQKYAARLDGLARLASLLPENAATAEKIAARLKLSNRDGDRLAALAILPEQLRKNAGAQGLRRILYAHGAENVQAALFLNEGDIGAALTVIEAWENPLFPIKGEDIVASGIPAGPRIGEILRAVEEWWIAGDFRSSRAACLAHAAQYGKNH
ncbi:MAG: CCA tRNA nucleotidyltransferase [Alphaproteobacteria bacterium]|nr:CCA tRNA nucleotidyltransferase [Alphaproteobacteria bacterium]